MTLSEILDQQIRIIGHMAAGGILSTKARDQWLRQWFVKQREMLHTAHMGGEASITIEPKTNPEIPMERQVVIRKTDDLVTLLADVFKVSHDQMRNIIYEK